MPNYNKDGKTKMARGGAMMMDEPRTAMAKGGKVKGYAKGGMVKKANCGASMPPSRGKK